MDSFFFDNGTARSGAAAVGCSMHGRTQDVHPEALYCSAQSMTALLENAPVRGYLLAYYRDRLVFEPYEIREGELLFAGAEALHGEMPLECHLFDRNKEVRFVSRSEGCGPVVRLLTRDEEQEMDPDLLFEENVLVKPEYASDGVLPERLTIINRFRYSRDDTLTLRDYRIAAP